MKIVFLGYGNYGAASLRGLLQDDEIVIDLVVSHPPKKGDRFGSKVLELARANGVHALQSRMLSEECIRENIRSVTPDAIVSTNWRRKIPREVFSLGRLGALNIHDALLPRYGGLSAEQWVILNGEAETGVTVHFVIDLMDAGPIIHQISFDIDENDTAEMIASKQLDIYPIIICEALKKLKAPNFKPKSSDPSKYTRFHALKLQDAKLQFCKSPGYIDKQIKAWSGQFGDCWIEVNNQKYWVLEVQFPQMVLAGEPGRVVTHSDEGVWIVTAPCTRTGQSGIVIKQLRTECGELVDARKIISNGKHLS